METRTVSVHSGALTRHVRSRVGCGWRQAPDHSYFSIQVMVKRKTESESFSRLASRAELMSLT